MSLFSYKTHQRRRAAPQAGGIHFRRPQFNNYSSGDKLSKSYGLGTGWISPAATSRCRSRRFPFKAAFDALPTSLPDCHLVRTAILLLSRGQVLPEQPRCFPPQSHRLLASFAKNISRGNSAKRCGHNSMRLVPYPQIPLKAGYSAHSIRHLAGIPQCRFNPVPYIRSRSVFKHVKARKQVST